VTLLVEVVAEVLGELFDRAVTVATVSSLQSPPAIFFITSGALPRTEPVSSSRKTLDLLDRDPVEVAVGGRVDLDHLILDRQRLALTWLSVRTSRSPRAKVRCVPQCRGSEPNCENASSSRYCERSSFNRPATFRIGVICALPPTRETRSRRLIAGLTPERNSSPLQIDLAVGDRDHVRRDVRRDVARLGLDDRERGQRAAARLLLRP